MTRVLYIEGSPNKTHSVSIDVCSAFLAAYQLKNPDHSVQKLDIWDMEIPEFDMDMLSAKYAGLNGEALSPVQDKAWTSIKALAAPFLEADKFLFGVPLWNFSIPYKLKQLIDVISQKDVLFTLSSSGFSGMLQGKKAAVVYARGLNYTSPGSFTPSSKFDLQQPYMETWLKFVGVENPVGLVVERTVLGAERDTQRAMAIDKARAIARDF